MRSYEDLRKSTMKKYGSDEKKAVMHKPKVRNAMQW